MRALSFLLAWSLVVIHSPAAIPVTTAGSGTNRFTARPAPSEWATGFISGTDVLFGNVAQLRNAVQTNVSATSLNNQLLDAGSANPPSQNALAAWTLGGSSSVSTRPTLVGATLLVATLVNNTGMNQNGLQIAYTLQASGSSPDEQVPGHEVFYSLSGGVGTWTPIAELSGGLLGASIAVIGLSSPWTNGGSLFVLWADDNATAGVDRSYSLDDVSFAAVPEPIRLTLRRIDATRAEMTWGTNAMAYRLESNADLANPNWTIIGSPGQYPIGGGVFRTNILINSGQRHFRLQAP